MDPVALAKTLVGIASPTGAEADIADFLSGELRGRPFRLVEQPVSGRRRNILAAAGDRPRVILCTHLDTVPGSAPTGEDDAYLYGRGACDAKGSLAAMMAAADRLAEAGVGGFGLLFLVGEETDSIGARAASELGLRPDYLIVGEPTENRFGIGHKGALFVRLKVRGKRAHSALPHLGESALEKLLDLLAEIRRADFGADPILGPTLLNIGRVEGGIAPNVVPDEAEAVLGFRPAVSTAEVLSRLERLNDGRAETDIMTASEPQRMWRLPGLPTAVFPFGTDIAHLRSLGRPMLIGPGSARWAHSEEERIEKIQILEAAGLYESLVHRLLAGEQAEPPAAGGRSAGGS
jgi:acetylornithine deacetylase